MVRDHPAAEGVGRHREPLHRQARADEDVVDGHALVVPGDVEGVEGAGGAEGHRAGRAGVAQTRGEDAAIGRGVGPGVEVAHQHDPRRFAVDLGRGEAGDQFGALFAGDDADMVEMGVANVQKDAVAAVAQQQPGDGAGVGGVPALRRPVRRRRTPQGLGPQPLVAVAPPEQGRALADEAVVAAEAVAVPAGQLLRQPVDHGRLGLLHPQQVGVVEGDLVRHVRAAFTPGRSVGRDVDADVVAHHPERGRVAGRGGRRGRQEGRGGGEEEGEQAGREHGRGRSERQGSASSPPRGRSRPHIGLRVSRSAAACPGCGGGVTVLSGARLSRRARCETRPRRAFFKHFRPLIGAHSAAGRQPER